MGWEHLIISLPAKAQAKIALKLLIAFHLERVVFPPLHPTEFGGCSGFPLAAIYRRKKTVQVDCMRAIDVVASLAQTIHAYGGDLSN